MFLEELGYNSALMFIDAFGEVFNLGSVEGFAFSAQMRMFWRNLGSIFVSLLLHD